MASIWFILGVLLAPPEDFAPTEAVNLPLAVRPASELAPAKTVGASRPLVSPKTDDRRPVEPSPPRKLSPRTQGQNRSADQEKGRSSSLVWWSTSAIGLLIVLVTLAGVLRTIRVRPGVNGPGANEGPVQLLTKTSLSPTQGVCLLRVGQRLLLVGLGADAPRTLLEITDPEEVDLLAGQAQQLSPRSAKQSFRELLRKQAAELDETGAQPPKPAGNPLAQLVQQITTKRRPTREARSA